MKLLSLLAFSSVLLFVGCASNNLASNNLSSEKNTSPEISDAAEKSTDTPETQDNNIEETKPDSASSDSASDAQTPGTDSSDKETKSDGNQTGGEESPKTENEETEPEKDDEMQSANFKTLSSLKSACDEAKFIMASPEAIGEYEVKEYRAAEGLWVESVYESKSTGQKIEIRKSLGNLETVGEESEYEVNRFVSDGGNRIFLRGDSPSRFYTGTWTSGDYVFSVKSSSGLPRESFLTLIREIN